MKKAHLVLGIISLFILSNCGAGKMPKVDPYLGTWSLLIEDTPQGDVNATMTILKNEAGAYTGTLSSDMGAFKLTNFNIEANKLSGVFVVQDMDFDLTGDFVETTFNGFVSGMGADFTTSGSKVVQE
jgi:hypothetical protein